MPLYTLTVNNHPLEVNVSPETLLLWVLRDELQLTGNKFIIGSVNKMFTTTGILQLLNQNKISLKDFVSNVLTSVLADSLASKIKIKHLLTHTSGLDDYLFTPEMSQNQKAQEFF